ncbi:DUF736 domain-containing protein [Mesorhizobium sp. M1227]|uniref:DUF736 domain-containing protein n=1 Tax=Mesorhizobium sp. M1227 TaxID=2957071 RepID=UPI00333A2D4E
MPRSCPGGLSAWLVWRQAGLRPATASLTFFPCAEAHSSRTKKLGCRRPPLTLRPYGCKPAVPSPEDRYRGRAGRLRGTVRRYHNGSNRHLHQQRRWRPYRHDPHPQRQRQATIRPVAKDNERGPDYRVVANGVELGAGWRKAAKDTGADYVSVKLDDPSFTAPVYATLVQSDNGEHKLIWSR